MNSAIQQIVGKVQNHESRLKVLEGKCGKCDTPSLKDEDVKKIVEESNKKFVDEEHVENTFQKYIQAEHNMTNQLSANQKAFNEKFEQMTDKIASVLAELDSVRSENNELTNKLSALEAHHNALTISHNELKDSLNSE